VLFGFNRSTSLISMQHPYAPEESSVDRADGQVVSTMFAVDEPIPEHQFPRKTDRHVSPPNPNVRQLRVKGESIVTERNSHPSLLETAAYELSNRQGTTSLIPEAKEATRRPICDALNVPVRTNGSPVVVEMPGEQFSSCGVGDCFGVFTARVCEFNHTDEE